MLCEEKGFFLEIVDIIQGFGLTILKGVMEVRENKIWACFVVEAEVNLGLIFTKEGKKERTINFMLRHDILISFK